MIEKVISLALAEELLENVVENVGDDVNCSVECFENGKEHGFSIFSDEIDESIIFAKDRRSDQIVVYTGNKNATISKYNRETYDYYRAVYVVSDFLRANFR